MTHYRTVRVEQSAVAMADTVLGLALELGYRAGIGAMVKSAVNAVLAARLYFYPN